MPPSQPIRIDPTTARRLAIARQGLAGPPGDTTAAILTLVRTLGCLQIDPISVVAPSHLLVLHSRLGPFAPALVENLRWRERRLFDYWAHEASIVPIEDYPIHSWWMRKRGTPTWPWRPAYQKWLDENRPLRRRILAALRRHGPLTASALAGDAPRKGRGTGWGSGHASQWMLFDLWHKGRVLVAGREGGTRTYDLAERILPDGTPREQLTQREVVRRCAERALRALGVARPEHIREHFTRRRYPGLETVLAGLEREGRIRRIEVREGERAWPGTWYVHGEDLALVERLAAGHWEPRTTLLSPFDNLICDRRRTSQLFGFDFAIEIYKPATKRRYGYYVMPILHGDRLIGRMDQAVDRRTGCLEVKSVHAENDAPTTRAAARAVAAAIRELAAFVGARDIAYRPAVPSGWRRWLR
jgi:uncharacterized protein YcaQ